VAAAAFVCGCSLSRVEADRGNSTGVGGSSAGDASTDGPVCAYGQFICDGNIAKLCDGQGAFALVRQCKDECKDGRGCVSCVPNTGTCDPTKKNLATFCDPTGSYTATFTCDGQCDPDGCKSPCSPMMLGTNNVGCDFWSTVTANSVWTDHLNSWDSGLHFGVLLGNTSTEAATIRISGPLKAGEMSVVLQPSEVQAVPLEWVSDLKGSDWATPWQPESTSQSVNSVPDPMLDPYKARHGAYHIQSSRPIVAYQFNPIDGTAPYLPTCPSVADASSGCFSYSTDASLLLPWHTLFGASYTVTGYHALHQEPFPAASKTGSLDMGDFVAITATQNMHLTLTLRPGQTVLPWMGSDMQIDAGQPLGIDMRPAQVLELFTPGKSADETLSGAEITSDGQPIQVVSGMGCASIPLNPGQCGHMEDVVLPKEAFGKEYIVPVLHPPASGDGGAVNVKLGHTIRIQAIADGTALTFEPNMMTGVTLGRGEVLEIPNVAVDVRISSTVAFGVTQFVNGRSPYPNPPQVGGPNQLTAVASSQFQTSYVFAAAPGFDNYVAILAPTGGTVTLDGHPILSSQFAAVAASGMSVAHSNLESNNRIHSIVADKPIGIVVYGYTQNASYAYPGGLDLTHGPVTH
jgi:hypothetical protein